MELKFTPLRVAALVALLVGYALLGGFVVPPDLPARAMRQWALILLLFVLGAISATVTDHWVGTLDRSNLRWFSSWQASARWPWPWCCATESPPGKRPVD